MRMIRRTVTLIRLCAGSGYSEKADADCVLLARPRPMDDLTRARVYLIVERRAHDMSRTDIDLIPIVR